MYSIDTSAILDGWRRYYPPDVFPLIWTRLDELIYRGELVATEEVLVELGKKDDEVYRWALQRDSMFIPHNRNIQLALRDIMRDHGKLIDQRTNRSGADPWVIALARVNSCAVLTGERLSTSLNRPRIPDVCQALGVRWLTMMGLFREQKWIFA